MLNVRIEDVEKIIQDVADTTIVPHFRNLHAHEIHFKSEDNPVTIADSEAETALRQRLLSLFPSSKVLGEEAFATNPDLLSLFAGDDPVWTIDPVDGTKAFISGEPYYGVIVSLAKNNETLAAWLYDPTSREFVTAEKGSGAWHKGKRLSVMKGDAIENMSGMLGSRLIDALEACETPPHVKSPKFERMLSSCHDYARLVVAEPHFSGHVSQMHFHCWKNTCTPWDNAAGILISEEAGGYSAHWNGDPFAPSHYQRGILSAPDKESWLQIRNWIASFCDLPKE